ncbi:uncharacterized protein B0T15DRAFT_308225 [Chaetomium strumarium]|uniref:Uncharacterized protein n=1 Tax=Chaetomium strumarium TaxID=1170767 RepID=A0AAJ0LYM9_9PEZI|nr:hypothetical protein B0T15DRAFT_308225 [Chaetomium strumarium]
MLQILLANAGGKGSAAILLRLFWVLSNSRGSYWRATRKFIVPAEKANCPGLRRAEKKWRGNQQFNSAIRGVIVWFPSHRPSTYLHITMSPSLLI